LPEIKGELRNLMKSSGVGSNLERSYFSSFKGTLFIFLKKSKLSCSLDFGGD